MSLRMSKGVLIQMITLCGGTACPLGRDTSMAAAMLRNRQHKYVFHWPRLLRATLFFGGAALAVGCPATMFRLTRRRLTPRSLKARQRRYLDTAIDGADACMHDMHPCMHACICVTHMPSDAHASTCARMYMHAQIDTNIPL